MNENLDDHVREVNRCNQRGGRMLSIVDLLRAGTLDRSLAAYLLFRISSGASFLVGAQPGGAGKTAVMCALLGCVPPGRPLVPAESLSTLRRLKGKPTVCLICHEIGSGPYYAYLWGKSARVFFSLRDHQLATNLHVDTLEECRDQLCGDNAVPVDDFNRVEIQVFLEMAGGWTTIQRKIATVWDSHGSGKHRLVYESGTPVGFDPADRTLAPYTSIVDEVSGGEPDVLSVRRRIVELLAAG